jgi:CHRD domain-containing protein
MRKLLAIIGVSMLGLGVTAVAGAHHRFLGSHSFHAKLTGAQETPPVTTDAKGIGQFRLRKDDGGLGGLRYLVLVRKIDNVTLAHIHCAKRGEAGPIVADLYPATGAQAATLGNGWVVRGTVTTVHPNVQCKLRDGTLTTVTSLQDLVRLMRRGLTYANVHTTDFPNGEIRGQIHRHGHGFWF